MSFVVNRSLILWLILGIWLIMTPPGFGQAVTATITGTVSDSSGSIIPKANLTLTNEASGDVRRTVTNSVGYYSFPAVLAGSYKLTVESQGFQKFEQTGIACNGADRRNIDAVLQLGPLTQTVEVQTIGETITPIDSGEKAQTVTSNVLENIALVGPSAAEFLKILPGITQSSNGVYNRPAYDGHVIGINGTGDSGNQSALGNFAANGTPTNSTDVVADGAHVADPGCNCATPVNPHPEMIQEMKVLTSNYNAENSKGPVVVSSISKSGGMQFHGGAHVSVRDSSLIAGDWIDNKRALAKPPDRFVYPGFVLGGPVLLPWTKFNRKHDKLFFFTGYEYFYQKIDTGQIQASLPTQAMLNGDFSPASIAALGPAGLVPGNPQPVNSPEFPGGLIPQSQWDKGGAVLMKLYPKPNANPFTTGGYNYVSRPIFNQNGWQWMIRTDYSISDNTKLFFRYNLQQETQKFIIQMWRGASTLANSVVPYPSPINAPNQSQAMSTNLTHVFTPTLTNELIFSYTYIPFINHYANPDAVSPTKIGYPYQGVFHVPHLLFPNLTSPTQEVAQMANNGGFETAPGGNTYQAIKHLVTLGDNLAKVWNAHTFKFGFYGEYIDNSESQSSPNHGAIGFAISNPNTSGNAYADMLLGRANTFSQQNTDPIFDTYYRLYEFYVQDTWRVTKRLNLDYGIRFQHIVPWTDSNSLGFAVWTPSTYTSDPNAYFPALSWHERNPAIGLAGYPTRALFYAPRFGMAWDVLGSGNTVIRGGIGQFHYPRRMDRTGMQAPTGSYSYSIPSPMTLAGIEALNTPVHSTYQSSQTLANQNDDNTPTTLSYNLTLSQRIPGHSLFEVAYVGNQTTHLSENQFHNQNAVPYGTLVNVPNANSVNYSLYRPLSYYQDVNIIYLDAWANYNSLQTAFNHQSSRYTLMVNYTLSKSMGLLSTAGLGGSAIDALPGHLDQNYSPLPFDRRHVFNAAYSVNLGNPVKGNLLAKGALNGWQISGVVQLESGTNLQMNGSANFSAVYPSGVTARTVNGTTSITAMPLLTCNPNKNLGNHQYINGSCFAVPTPGNNGPIVMPEMFGPWFVNSDLSLFKTFQITERHRVQFRAEGFNFLNHPVYSFGNDQNLNLTFNSAGQLTNPAFGYVTNKIGHRIIALALKYNF